MSPSPILIPRVRLEDPSRQKRVDPFKSFLGIPTHLLFAATAALLLFNAAWPWRWLVSGAPILTFFILQGASEGYRILPIVPLWTLLTTLNLFYAVSATSWLLYGCFAAACYPAIFITCLFQFDLVANFVRGNLRSLLRQLHFINDKIAFFNIPALEIDRDVAGLMVIRGLTMSLSHLTIIAHGIEVGIKLTEDIEIALQVETVKIALFRRIEIGDVYANLKGGQIEMDFHELDEHTRDMDADSFLDTDTPLLRAATFGSEVSLPQETQDVKEEMTNGAAMEDSSAKESLESVTQLSPDDEQAWNKYQEMLKEISETSTIRQCQDFIKQQGSQMNTKSNKDVRAAVCSQLHDKPSVPHPPRRSIKVTTLQNLSPPYVRTFMHRLPMLLRLLLNPLSYFHPISIKSITAAGSGAWIKHMLVEHVLKHYAAHDSEIRRLEARITAWLSDASFILELVDVTGLAQVPFLTGFDIVSYLAMKDVMAYRAVPEAVTLKQVLRLGGADATFIIPAFLLPHHEHLLPPKPTASTKAQLAQEVDEADGKPKTLQAEATLQQAEKDETNVRMSVHASLPAVVNQELLNFVAALVKVTKVVELEKEKEERPVDEDVSRFKEFTRNMNNNMKDGMKKAVVGGIVNDKWIAKMVGKIAKSLETAQGDVGYSGNIPLALEIYRPQKGNKLPSKILP